MRNEQTTGPDAVWAALERVVDPCLAAAGHRISVVGLGLITRVDELGDQLEIGITFTEVGCPFTHRVIDRIEQEMATLGGYAGVRVVPEWRPGWTPERLAPEARAALGDSRRLLGRRFTAAKNGTA